MELNKIREDFNMLSTKLVYFDNAATTLKPQIVGSAISEYYLNETANIHRGDYDLSLSVSDKYEETRKKVAEFINSKANEVVFTSGTTDSINRVCFGFAKKWLKSNDVILTTVADHASNLLPWFQLSKETGIGIEYIELSDEGAITIGNFKKAMHGRVKIVAIAHITNVMGHIAPIKELTAIAHDFGAIVVIDGAQSVPHIKTDVKELDIDFLSFSGHKMCGPTGVGVLFGKYHLLQVMDPTIFGGGSNARFDIDQQLQLKNPPHKFEAGTPPIASVLGLGKAIDYLTEIGLDQIIEHERMLRKYLVNELQKLNNFKIYNPTADSGIVAFNVAGIFAQDVSAYFNAHNIAVRAGDHCAKLLINLIGTMNTVRVSLYFYNTKEEINSFIHACQNITLEKCIDIALLGK